MATHTSTAAEPGYDPQRAPAPSRRALLAGAASLPALVAPEVCRASLSGSSGADAELLALAAALRRAEEDYAAAVDLDESTRSAAIDAASEHIDDLLERMADTPAAGFPGAAAKMARLIASLVEGGGHSISFADVGVAESLGADLARLAPEALPTAPAFPDPDAEPSAPPARAEVPETPFMRKAREESERLASLGFPRGYLTAGDVQLVGWLCRRVEADMGPEAAERLRELSAIPADSFGPGWRTLLDEIHDRHALAAAGDA